MSSTVRRSLLFAVLYFCEGAPIGFLWWALPAWWKDQGLTVDRIATMTAVLVLPWSLKWLWAPLIDWSSRWWPYRRWAISAQIAMGLMLVPLPMLDPVGEAAWLMTVLVLHALAAATQDVSIDALCIASVDVESRGTVNGWMQAGMLLGRALFGGGALLLIARTSLATTVALLVTVLWFAALVLVFWRPRNHTANKSHPPREAKASSAPETGISSLAPILLDRRIWIAVGFALLGGAAFESVGSLVGPFLIESGISLENVGMFQLLPLAGALAAGALAGGFAADRFGHWRVASCGLLAMLCLNITLGAVEAFVPREHSWLRLVVICAEYGVVGVFTASSYALLMDLSAARWKATLFSAFMGATNACEAASTFAAGKLAVRYGFATTFVVMIVPSLLGLALLWLLRPEPRSAGAKVT